MEDFSTVRHRLVPWTTNACTLTVLVMATWWSSAQHVARDASQPVQSSATTPAPSVTVTTPRADAPRWALLGKTDKTVTSPDAVLQPVGFQAPVSRH